MVDPIPSPYTPGRTTVFTPGREKQLGEYDALLASVVGLKRFHGQVHVVHGARGVGKTSLLRSAERKARRLGLTTVFITATGEEGLSLLADGLRAELHRLDPASVTDRFLASISTLGVKLGPAEVTSDVRRTTAPANAVTNLQAAVTAVARCTARASTGLALFIDEMQDVPRADIRTIATAWQHLQAEADKDDALPIPAILLTAGLSSTPDAVTDGASFGERFDFNRLGNLDEGASLTAIDTPARELGVTWQPQAIQIVLDRAAGYPYFIQLIAEQAWRVRIRRPGDTITLEQAQQGVCDAEEKIATFYRGRWNKATLAERRLLAAMAKSGQEEMRRADIARVMGVATTDISVVRESLLGKGLLAVPRHGWLAFNAPGFGDFIREEVGERHPHPSR